MGPRQNLHQLRQSCPSAQVISFGLLAIVPKLQVTVKAPQPIRFQIVMGGTTGTIIPKIVWTGGKVGTGIIIFGFMMSSARAVLMEKYVRRTLVPSVENVLYVRRY